jgi:hypothetical protein
MRMRFEAAVLLAQPKKKEQAKVDLVAPHRRGQSPSG